MRLRRSTRELGGAIRPVHRLLLASATMVALALAGPVASSHGDIDVYNKDDLMPCPAVTTSGTDVNGGCLAHATSESGVTIRKHVFGIESQIAVCNSEFHMRVGEGGTGYLLEQQLSGASCTREACNEAAGESTPWPFTANEGSPVEGTEYLTTTFCVEPIGGGTDESCEIDLPFQHNTSDLSIELGHSTELPSHGITGFRCELVGHWATEIGGTHDSAAEQRPVFALNTPAEHFYPDPDVLYFEHMNGTLMVDFVNNTHQEITTSAFGPRVGGPGAERFEFTAGCTGVTRAANAKCEMSVVRMTPTTSTENDLGFMRIIFYFAGGGVGVSEPLELEA
jgi:hypothetical protein